MPLTNEEYAELVEGIPSPSDPVIQKYLSSKEALIAEEKKHRSDHSFRQALSPLAKRACAIFSTILQSERKAAATEPEYVAPEAQDTKSYQILQLLPKGAILNVHLHDLVDVTHLAELVSFTEGLCISSSEGHLGTDEARRDATVRIRSKATAGGGGRGEGIEGEGDTEGEEGSIWDESYTPGRFIDLPEAAVSFPRYGRGGFIPWLRGRFLRPDATDGESESGGPERQEDSNSAESLLHDVLYYEPIFRAALQRVLELLGLDGVSWAELRLTFPLGFYRENSETPEEDCHYLFSVIDEEVTKFKAGLEPDQMFWGVRVVWSTSLPSLGNDSSSDTVATKRRVLVQDMDACISTKLAWPDLVGGYDPSSLTESHIPELFWFRKQCAEEDVQIPFHFGSVTLENLFDTLLLGARRVTTSSGEGLSQHPRLLEAVKDKKILVGVSPPPLWPVSRVKLKSGFDAAGTLSGLVAQGVGCAVTVGDERQLSRELWNLVNDTCGKEGGIDLATLGWMAESSVRWASFEDLDAGSWTREIREASVGNGTKAERLRKLAVEWERFCLCVVDEFGEEDANDGLP
ncbi:Metallo-dependent hydrolase [Cladorrhinum sp. PSN259]|nr:Metallo-dependent hydrolase [Cladorrhinum sp. PSN259]